MPQELLAIIGLRGQPVSNCNINSFGTCPKTAQRKLASANTETSREIRLNASLFVSAEHWPVDTLTGVRKRGAAVGYSKQEEIIKDRNFQPLASHTKIAAASSHVRDAISRRRAECRAWPRPTAPAGIPLLPARSLPAPLSWAALPSAQELQSA